MNRDLHQARYRILGTDLSLASDSERLLELFDRDYRSFRTAAAGDSARLSIRAFFNGAEGPEIQFREGEREGRQSLDGHPTPVHHAWQWVTQTLFDSLHGYLLLHAAVAVRNRRAVILAGPPGAGKTTTALDLAEAGFTIYSDEICPVHRRSGRVHPFPRSFWVVPQEGPESGKIPLPPPAPGSGIADDETAVPGLLLILDPGPAAGSMGRLVLGARDGGWESLLEAVGQLHPGIEVSRPRPGVPEFHLDYPLGEGLSARLAELLDGHRDCLLNLFRAETARPDFSRSPVLVPIPVHRAAFCLLPGLKQRVDSSGRDRNAGSAERMKELIEYFGETACWGLTVGCLEEQMPLVRRLALDATDPPEREQAT